MFSVSRQFPKRKNSEPVLAEIADYVLDFEPTQQAYDCAFACFKDAIACALMALEDSACARLLGPVVPGATLKNGARIPGTAFQLEPVQAAFNIGTMIRWLDYNDTWLAAEWGHPSDNIASILALSDYLSRQRIDEGKPPVYLRDVLVLMIKAYEIQGILSLKNSFNWQGLDHVLLVRIASTAVSAYLLGANRTQIINALAHAWMDGGALRTYRHAPNTGARKGWAAGDAARRAVQLALLSRQEDADYPCVLSAKAWGFYDVLFSSKAFEIPQAYASHVIENILFKINFPAEFHAQTAIEAAIKIRPQVKHKLSSISVIKLHTQRPAMCIINKTGPLYNPADRDHCLQYMVAIALIFGSVKTQYYADQFAADPRIDKLRDKMQVIEDEKFSSDYYDTEKCSVSNAIQVYFNSGECTDKVTVEYPIGHKQRRSEAMPFLQRKFTQAISSKLQAENRAKVLKMFTQKQKLLQTPINEVMDLLAT